MKEITDKEDIRIFDLKINEVSKCKGQSHSIIYARLPHHLSCG